MVSNSPSSIMQITWSLVAGGAEMYALTLARNVDPARHRVRMCGIDQGGALEDELHSLGIPYDIMHRSPGVQWSLMKRMLALFREHRVSVIHTHHFNQLFYSVLGAKLTGARIIHTEHSIEAYKRRRLRWAMRLLSHFCDKITLVGPDGYRVLREQVGISADKLEVIRAGVDVEQFNLSRTLARTELELNEDDHVAVIIARLFPEKNHRLLLDAFADVCADDPQARLLIAGEGVERQAIATAIRELRMQDRVRLLGVRRDVPRLLAASDVFVLSSDREGLPIAVLEAMAAARPVIATAVGDLPGVIIDGETGLLVPRRDRAALATAIGRIFNDRHGARRMGQFGRRLVHQRYSIETMVRRYERLYQGESSAREELSHPCPASEAQA